ncbi:hypothetical protein C0Q70_17072 [Pomacea canaliculata]|uniref:TauD/TfdA-like domain-containing protein n=1 Tax=Pomacea canaliculata TaxID=400727 RepID=A0A2T7NRM0_POMCA|nr:uncharacterized protein LOC112574493 isoform X2 [Pomacea canaliculata]PVD23798.1 hypothetical protein C0Q70_17072 [Pomacea canaliculata]
MQYNPAPIGVEVRGIDLKQHVPDQIIQQIKKDVHKHRLLIFKNQGIISADRHVEISRWFGELESTFYKHPKSPHPDVFRVSNCEEEGCTNVGRTGWHIDGSFMEKPFSYALYHMVAVPKNGNTAFVPLKELVESLSEETRVQWERLWRTDHHYQVIHPLIYQHPVTGDPWEVGDFIISDNLAVGHEATPETQLSVEEVGLRVLHRTTVAGKWTPVKSRKTEQ